jgi:NAD(P)-dependent dehydrogenase (short-subunit alcohol dehydrogenase family)
VAIVTGGYVGVGLETTRALAGGGGDRDRPGADDPEKARAALAGIERVELESVELSEPARPSTRFAKRGSWRPGVRFTYLINNAGIMAVPFAKSPREGSSCSSRRTTWATSS